VSDFDRQLINLISTLTDESQVVLLRDVVEDYSTELTERAIRDGFGAIALEDKPNLIFRYAADEPEAIAEVRSRHGRD
jgi:hypothetical protein